MLGSLWIDLGRRRPTRPAWSRTSWWAAGYMRHSHRFGERSIHVSGEGSFTAGGGARVRVTDGVYVGGDVRIGWELHLRRRHTWA